MEQHYPVFDLHCDLLCYLAEKADAREDSLELGATIPYLKEGNVKLQVMAVFSATHETPVALATQEVQHFKRLLGRKDMALANLENLSYPREVEGLTILAAIENASGFCGEGDDLKTGIKLLESFERDCGRLLYISMTHNDENRFGGGNFSKAGLKKDGAELLRWMNGRRIAIDLAHTSDWLAFDILSEIDKKNYQIPVIASHSNYRKVWDHQRNLPDDLAKEIIKRKGLIGLNLLRLFLHETHSETLLEHIHYGLSLGAEFAICFGADYYYTLDHPDYKSRVPFFFPEHEHAGKYPSMVHTFHEDTAIRPFVEGIAYQNVLRFLKREIF